MLEDIVEIAVDFSLIVDGRRGVWLELDYNPGSDFAKAEDHIIHLNGGYFGDLEQLEREYDQAVEEHRFVKGTDWRAIARHEIGHVVSNLYHIDPMEVAFTVRREKNKARLLQAMENELSLYSAEYEDGREIISECFSAYYSKVGNQFADEYVKRCMEVSKDEII